MVWRYEIVRSFDPALLLIFREHAWEDLPFEIRLSHRWYNAGFCDRRKLAATERGLIDASGYCIVADEDVRGAMAQQVPA